MGKQKKTRKPVKIADVLTVQAFLEGQSEPLTIEQITQKMVEAEGLQEDYASRQSSYEQGIRRECERLTEHNKAEKTRQGRAVVYSILTPEQAAAKAKEQAEIKAKQEKIEAVLEAQGFTSEEKEAIFTRSGVSLTFDQFLNVLDN